MGNRTAPMGRGAIVSDFTDDMGVAEPPEDGVRCKFCGATGLEWVDTGMRWRLVDEAGKFHECRTNVAGAEDFE